MENLVFTTLSTPRFQRSTAASHSHGYSSSKHKLELFFFSSKKIIYVTLRSITSMFMMCVIMNPSQKSQIVMI